MVDSNKISDWLNKAVEDLQASKILYNYGGAKSLVGFHAHQSIEKALKAFLLFKTGNLEKGHSLIYLNKLCAKHDRQFQNFNYDCAEINRFYIKTRYPADLPLDINLEEAEKSIDIAEKIINLIKNKTNHPGAEN